MLVAYNASLCVRLMSAYSVLHLRAIYEIKYSRSLLTTSTVFKVAFKECLIWVKGYQNYLYIQPPMGCQYFDIEWQ